MRRPGLGLLVVVALAMAGAAALAIAQEVTPITLTADVKAKPNKAGTAKHPRGVTFDVRANIQHAGEPPLLETIDVWLPKVGAFNGGNFPACTLRALNERGPSACPVGSIVWTGPGGHADVEEPRPPSVTVVNGGQHKVYFFLAITNPARVRTTVVATITKVAGSSRWAAKAHVEIPPALRVVAGLRVPLDLFHVRLGRRDWITSTSCPPDGRWRYHVVATFDNGRVATHGGGVPCRPS